jgi:hypothetical protein
LLLRDIPEIPGEAGKNYEEMSAGVDSALAEIITEEIQKRVQNFNDKPTLSVTCRQQCHRKQQLTTNVV